MTWELQGATILEVVPPTLESGDEGVSKRLRRVEKLLSEGSFDAVNLPEIHDEESRDTRGVRKLDFSNRLDGRIFGQMIREQFDVPVIVNHVVAHAPLDHQILWLHETVREYGITDMILVGAPHDRQIWPGPSVAEANNAFKSEFADSDLRVGNICIPERPGSPIPESERMAEKVGAGADFFTTQILFCAAEISQLWQQFSKNHSELLQIPVLISLCPVKKSENLAFLRYLGVQVPNQVEETLGQIAADECLDASLEILCELQKQILESSNKIKDLASPGWNIAPVGSIPASAVLDLMQRLPSAIPS
ncbi:MAG: hypothetical protein CBC13_07390 [Planctomycetia bacterium TMED53]|nr:MAG: hypothetical protein CBC13_07390 [Planctomycetia bacterium TMED53]